MVDYYAIYRIWLLMCYHFPLTIDVKEFVSTFLVPQKLSFKNMLLSNRRQPRTVAATELIDLIPYLIDLTAKTTSNTKYSRVQNI